MTKSAKQNWRTPLNWLLVYTLVFFTITRSLSAQTPTFHDAPASAKASKNPYEGQVTASSKHSFHQYCARCHGENGEGSGNIPSLNDEKVKAAAPGELFWFITKGSIQNGMPSWAKLSPRTRWQIVSYVQALGTSQAQRIVAKTDTPSIAKPVHAPPPKPPFTDFRYEKPGVTRKITLQDLPGPLVTPSASNGPKVVARPEGAWPQVPHGFKVEQYATGLEDPRQIRTAPNGDFFVAESSSGEIRIFRGITQTGKPELVSVFASGLNRPFGVNFSPPGPNPK